MAAIVDVPIGIQSWCFRESKTNAQVAQRLKSCGVDGVELCGVHVDFSSLEDGRAAVDVYRNAGIRILGTGVNLLCGEAASDRPLFEFLRLAGVERMAVTFPVGIERGALRNVESMADEYDVRLGIHNHGGNHWLGGSEMLGHLFSITGSRIGLWLDTAWALDAGVDPIDMILRFAERLHGLHIKDFTFDAARRRTDVVAGTGNLDLAALTSALASVGFDGPAIVEYEGDPENPVPALTACVERVRAAFAG